MIRRETSGNFRADFDLVLEPRIVIFGGTTSTKLSLPSSNFNFLTDSERWNRMYLEQLEKFTQLEGSGAGFLTQELDLGLTFATMARESLRRGRIRSADRERAEATKAHEAVLKFLPSATLTSEQKTKIERRLSELESQLERLAGLVVLLAGTSPI